MSSIARLCAEISPDSIRHNFEQVRLLAPDSRVISVIKANGYGHGLLRVAASLPQSDAFAVATLEEGAALRAHGITHPIVLLSGFFAASQVEALLAQRIDPVIYHAAQVEWLARAQPDSGARVAPWLKIDSGMNRLGFTPESAAPALERLRTLKAVSEVRMMTHFAAAEATDGIATRAQLQAYQPLRTLPCEHSLANSAAITTCPQSHADWVRPGVMLYGASPLPTQSAHQLQLRPAMCLRSRLLAVSTVKKGDGVGYGALWRCPENMPVGIVACGYGDGYPRLPHNDAPIAVAGHRTHVIGAVSMDTLAIDLRPLPQAKPGTEVELWGEQIPLNEVATAANSIPHHLLCNIGERVPRVVVGEATHE